MEKAQILGRFTPNFSDQVRVTADLPRRYAQVSGDYSPVHLNSEFAKAQGLRGPILHGLCTASLMVAAACRHLQAGENLQRAKFRFEEPVYPGDELNIQGTLRPPNPQQTQGTHCYALTCQNQEQKNVLNKIELLFRDEKGSSESFEAPLFALHESEHHEDFRVKGEVIEEFCQLVGQVRLSNEKAPPLFCGVYAFSPLVRLAEKAGIIPSGLVDLVLKSSKSQECESGAIHQEILDRLPAFIHVGQTFDFRRSVRADEVIVTHVKIAQRRQQRERELVSFLSQTFDEKGEMISSGRWLILVLS